MAETKRQLRATCPSCFREQAVRTTGSHPVAGLGRVVMVQHGYQRPEGWHANVNTCDGTNRPHFGTEAGRDYAKTVAASIRAFARAQREAARLVEGGELPVRDFKGREIPDPKPWDRKAAVQRLDGRATSADSTAANYERLIAAWRPLEPVEVRVEKRGPVYHARAKGRERVKACASGWSLALYSGLIADTEADVTCTRCLASRGRWAKPAEAGQ